LSKTKKTSRKIKKNQEKSRKIEKNQKKSRKVKKNGEKPKKVKAIIYHKSKSVTDRQTDRRTAS
jgi:hypothetical protein